MKICLACNKIIDSAKTKQIDKEVGSELVYCNKCTKKWLDDRKKKRETLQRRRENLRKLLTSTNKSKKLLELYESTGIPLDLIPEKQRKIIQKLKKKYKRRSK